MDNKISITFKNGEKKDFDVVLTFRNDKNNKDYVVYTDGKKDMDNKLKLYAAIYNPLTNEYIDVPESKEEWKTIYSLLDDVIR